MAGSINKVILVGNIGQEPQVRTMGSGQKVVSFSLATSDRWRDRSTGEQKEQTEWHRVVIFNPNLVDVAERIAEGNKTVSRGFPAHPQMAEPVWGRRLYNRSCLESIWWPNGNLIWCQGYGRCRF